MNADRIAIARRVLPPAGAGLAAVAVSALLPMPVNAGPYFLTLGLVWGGTLVLALVGWGRLLARVLLPGGHADWALAGAFGLAAAVTVGGVLNLAGAISRPLLLLVLAAGFAHFVFDAWPRRSDTSVNAQLWLAELGADRVRAGLLIACAVLLGLQLIGSVHGAVNTVSAYRDFDLHDDYQAYLVFPTRMLQQGGLGVEPFDARRMICLGGQPFLQTLVLAVLPLRALHLLDGGVALLLCAGLFAALLRDLGVAPRVRALVLVFAALIPQLEARGNTTAVLTGVALLLAWFRLASSDRLPPSRPLRNALLVALLASSLCALKPTFIPAAALFFAFSYAVLVLRGQARGSAVVEMLAGGVLVFVLLGPWMLALYRSSGTLLYPILGRGFFGSVYTNDFAAVKGDFTIPVAEMFEHIRRNLLRVLPLFALLWMVRERSPRRPVLALTLTAAATTVVLVLVNDPYLDRSIYRYCFPVVAAALLAALASALARDDREYPRPAWLVATVLAALLFTFGSPDTIARAALTQPARNVATGLSGEPLENAAQRQEMRTLQVAVPAGEPFLARVPFPFYFDFRRNPVRIDSRPGMASPPPGLPTFAGGEAVARYLGEHGFRYLAYGARSDQLRLLNLTETDITNRYPRSRVRWTMLVYHREFEKNVLELASTRAHLADAGESFVLDLASPAPASAPREAARVRPEQVADKVNVLDDNNWTTGDALLRGLRLGVPAGHRKLALAVGAAHPFRTEWQRLGVRVWANGQELPARGADGPVLLFTLPTGLVAIDELRVVSSTFVPRELGLGQDSRTLGIPIEWITTRQ